MKKILLLSMIALSATISAQKITANFGGFNEVDHDNKKIGGLVVSLGYEQSIISFDKVRINSGLKIGRMSLKEKEDKNIDFNYLEIPLNAYFTLHRAQEDTEIQGFLGVSEYLGVRNGLVPCVGYNGGIQFTAECGVLGVNLSYLPYWKVSESRNNILVQITYGYNF